MIDVKRLLSWMSRLGWALMIYSGGMAAFRREWDTVVVVAWCMFIIWRTR